MRLIMHGADYAKRPWGREEKCDDGMARDSRAYTHIEVRETDVQEKRNETRKKNVFIA